MMRAMMMEFLDDPAYDYLDRQCMLGDNVMVAPVLPESGDVGGSTCLKVAGCRTCSTTMNSMVVSGINSSMAS
ncbi:hypothetical protein O5623_17440 [Escherichia coli]|nr:hypothetical protein [Escherichia coli]